MQMECHTCGVTVALRFLEISQLHCSTVRVYSRPPDLWTAPSLSMVDHRQLLVGGEPALPPPGALQIDVIAIMHR